jgi:hypothetical protein
VALAGAFATPSGGADGSACDPTTSLCLVDAPPWTAPQVLTWKGPAGASGFDVSWRRGSTEGTLDRVRVAGDDGTTRTWTAVLPPDAGSGPATLVASTAQPSLHTANDGDVQPLVSNPELRIAADGGRRVAKLAMRTRGAARAEIQLSLRGRYPAEKYEIAKRWKVAKEFAARGSKHLDLATGDAVKRCQRYGSCEVRAKVRVSALDYTLARLEAHRSIATSPEKPTGTRTFVPGDAHSQSGGHRYDYAVYVEDGIKIDRRDFAAAVGATLADRRGWIRGGRVSFRQVSRAGDADTEVVLASPDYVDRLCAPLRTRGYASCTVRTRVVLNLNRWRYAVPHWTLSRDDYRRMVTNHEMGHRLGQHHRNCPGRGQRAPVMQQQTYSLQGCRANPWPLDYELAALKSAPRARRTFDISAPAAWLE